MIELQTTAICGFYAKIVINSIIRDFSNQKKMNICEECGYHLKMSSSDRIELLIDPGTWEPMDEDMVSVDPIEWDSKVDPGNSEVDPIEGDSEEYEDSSYKDRISSSQIETGLREAIQRGTGKFNGIPVAIGVM